jgi:ribonucleoside-diphosphate reductase alpha chain
MDYIFKWLNLRFLSGTQLSLFASLTPHAEQLPAPPTMIPETEDEEDDAMQQGQLAKLAEQVALRLNQVSNPAASSAIGNSGASGGGIPPAPQGTPSGGVDAPSDQTMADRGIFHAADAMRSMYEMGDAPSCSTCGAIMVRNGSCYRCMSCGSTSGCS